MASTVTGTPVIGADGLTDSARDQVTQDWFDRSVQDPAKVQQMRDRAPQVFIQTPAPALAPFVSAAPRPQVNAAAEQQGVRYKSIEDKNYRRMEKYSGAPGTWAEWSFDFVTTTQGINPEVGKVIDMMSKASEAAVTHRS